MTNKTDTQNKVFLRTYGCQMNEYDSEIVTGVLQQAGFVIAPDEVSADVILLNTCAVRENAHRKVYGAVHEIRHKRGGAPAIYGILGCMATNLRDELIEDKHLNIDFIAGPDSYRRLPELIRNAAQTNGKAADIAFDRHETFDDLAPKRKEGGINAWVTVMRGCDNFCTFCVVPYTRGRERSRSPETILKETRKAADDGFPQVTLLGQNVNSYKYEGVTFVDIIKLVSKVAGIKRIRFVAPHPKDFPDELIDTIAENKKVCEHIHLPIQSGNNRILEMMNRTYTHQHYLDLVKKIRDRIPSVALTTDIIVGFPTETAEEFQDTLTLFKEVEFDSAFIFKYSERKGTIATRKYKDDVPEEAKTERIVALNDLQKEISLEKNQAHIGQQQEMLIENENAGKSGKDFHGRIDNNKLVVIPAGYHSVGQLVNVKIIDATPHILRGEPKNTP